jgi:hypothetical protein
MSRSLKNLYPEKYNEYKNSPHYAFISATQVEANEVKQNCKQRSNYRCAICGDHAIDAHHIIPLRDGGTNDLENLICVCRRCHQQIHNGVYIINPDTHEISPGIIKDHEIDSAAKPSYISDYEKKHDITMYKQPTGRYYAFVDGIKTFFSVSDIKADIGYKPIVYSISPEKRRSINDRKVLAYWKAHFKEVGDKYMWHLLCKVIKNWDNYDDIVKDSIFATLHGNIGNFSQIENFLNENQQN